MKIEPLFFVSEKFLLLLHGLIKCNITMTVVSSKEFATKSAKYYRLAMNEQVIIRRGKNMFHLMCTNGYHTNEYDEILEPDEDLNNAITMDELLEKTYGVLHKFFEDKK